MNCHFKLFISYRDICKRYQSMIFFLVCFSDPICPSRSSSGLVPCATTLLSKFPHLRGRVTHGSTIKTQYPSPLLPQAHEGATRGLEQTDNQSMIGRCRMQVKNFYVIIQNGTSKVDAQKLRYFNLQYAL